MEVMRIGLDIAKDVFVAHGVDRAERAVLRKTLRRAQVLGSFAQLEPCLIAMESCASPPLGA